MIALKKLTSAEELFEHSKDWALLILRIIPSFYLFFYHGMRKITAGTESWEWLGKAAMPLMGINFGYVLFGFLAAFSEGILTWLVSLGVCTRISSLFIMITMFFAGAYHLADGESPESPFIYFTVYLVLFLLGPGKFSLDRRLFNNE